MDDVCAMGGTFLGLKEALWRNGIGEVSIILAHIDRMKNGLEKLADVYKNVYTTNSQLDIQTNRNINVTDLFE